MRLARHDDETLSQRELRNESGRVLRAVADGASFVLTNAGTPVGRIVPLDAPTPGLAITRPAKRVAGWAEIARDRVRTTPGQDPLAELREDRL